MSFFEKLKNGLIKTKNAFLAKIDDVLKHFVRIDEDFFDHVIEVASGKETKNELHGYREISIFKDGVTL